MDFALPDKRQKDYRQRFHRCAGMADSGNVDQPYLKEIAARDSLFPDMDYRIFQTRPWV